MKKIFKVLASTTVVLSAGVALMSCGEKGIKEIAVIKLGTHTSLDEIESEINKTVKAGINENYVVKNYDCSFQTDIIAQTLQGLDKNNLACVVCIATPTAVAAANTFTDIPVVFSAVSDPEAAGVTGDNVTGTSDAMQLNKLVDLAQEVDSDLKKIGYIYTATEANSISNKTKLETMATERGLTLQSKSINSSAEITETFNAMKDTVEAFIVSDDNNVASSMDTFSNLCAKANIPMYCAADSEVKDGGMMGYSINYSALGTYTGEQVLKIVIENFAVKDVPVKYFDKEADLNLYYNSGFLQTATQISISQALLAKATDLYQA